MSDFIQLTEKYKERSKQFCEDNGNLDVSTHLINVIVSVMMTRDEVLTGGSFVRSVVDNRLFEAINLADSECYRHLKLIVLANKECYLYD
jgi:hypothetical protein